MIKADIVEHVIERLECKKTEAIVYVESVFEIIKDTLETGEKVKISGFGVFEVKQKGDRRGRNPQTGETITIEARRVLTFKSSGVLRAAINHESLSP